MGSMKQVACVLVVFMVGFAAIAESAITCGTVLGNLSPCIGYLRGTVKAIPPPCCKGISSLNNAARTTPDRQAACNCIKNTAGTISGINYGLASSLPSKCGVNIPYKISPSTDCKTVK